MNIGPITHHCGVCGEQWWDAHCCPKQTPPMTVAGFFDEAKRLNLRMLGTPEETRAALDLKDAQIKQLRTALRIAREGYASEAATGLPVLPQWRERTVALIDAALGA